MTKPFYLQLYIIFGKISLLVLTSLFLGRVAPFGVKEEGG